MFLGYTAWETSTLALPHFLNVRTTWQSVDAVATASKNFICFGNDMLNMTGPISEIIFHEKVNKLCHENWLYLAFFIQSILCRLWTELRHPLSENGTSIQLGAGKWLDRLKYLLSDLMFDGQKIAVFNSTILPILPTFQNACEFTALNCGLVHAIKLGWKHCSI